MASVPIKSGMIRTVPTLLDRDQAPTMAGPRKYVIVFQQPVHGENFIKAVFDVAERGLASVLVLGEDVRFHSDAVAQAVIRIAAADGYGRVGVGRDEILSTPAISRLTPERAASGSLVLSASHKSGGPDGHFGIKCNTANGGPAPEKSIKAAATQARVIDCWLTVDTPDVDLSTLGETRVGDLVVELIGIVADHAASMSSTQ